MAGNGFLNPSNIRDVFDEVNRELGHSRDRVEMYIAGGARMILGIRNDRSTSDVDGLIKQGHGRLIKAAQHVSRRHADLEANWLNEEMSLSIPRKEDTGAVTLYTGKKLIVRGASKPHMLGMKLRAHREVDIADASALVDVMKIKDTRSAQKIAEEVYSEEDEKALQQARLEINVGLEHLAAERPDLVKNHEPRPEGYKLQPPGSTELGKAGDSNRDTIPKRPSADTWLAGITNPNPTTKRNRPSGGGDGRGNR